jgi:hypothetical protein
MKASRRNRDVRDVSRHLFIAYLARTRYNRRDVAPGAVAIEVFQWSIDFKAPLPSELTTEGYLSLDRQFRLGQCPASGLKTISIELLHLRFVEAMFLPLMRDTAAFKGQGFDCFEILVIDAARA